MNLFHKISDSILLSILLPIVTIAALVTVLGVHLLISKFDAYQRDEVGADLKLANHLAVKTCEERLHDLLALRLEDDPQMMAVSKKQTLEEIKQISQNFYRIHLLVMENQEIILATSKDAPRTQVKLPELRPGAPVVLSADLWGEPLLLHYDYFPLWRWHIVSYIRQQDYTALAFFTRRFIYASTLIGVTLILLMLLLVFYFRVNLPLKSLLKVTAAVGRGEFVTTAVQRRDEIGQVSQAFNDMVANLSASQEALKSSEATLQTLFRAAPIGIGLARRRVIVFANEQFSRMTGYSQAELRGMNARMLYPSEAEYQRVGGEKYADMSKFGIGTIETQMFHKQGHLIDVWVSSSPVNPADPDSDTVFTAIDISARRRVEEALKTSEARYRELVENANSIILRLTSEGVITFFNEFAERFFGYTKGEILGRNAVGTIVPARDSSGRDMEALIKNIGQDPERYATSENETMKRSGERVWVAWNNRAILDHQGQVKEILAVGTDVTARKRAEDERQNVLALLKASLDQSPAGILIADAPDSTIRYANPVALSIRGETDLPLTGIDASLHFKHWQTYRPDGVPYPGEELPLSRAIQKGEIIREEEVIIINSKGEKRWVSANAAPVRNADGAITSGIAIFQDITGRKQAEEEILMYKDHLQDLVKERTAALTASEARYRTIFEGAGFGIVLRDLDGKILAANPALEKIIGFSQEEMAQLGWSLLHPEDAPRFLSQFQELAEGQRDFFTIEARAFHRDGYVIWGRARQSRVKGNDDQTWYILGLIEDITAEKGMAEEIAAYQEQLRELAAELTMAEEKERRRLAEELHDQIGQILALTQLKLGALRQELADSQVLHNLDEIRGHLSRVIKTTRSFTSELGSRALDELGLEAGVQWLADKFREQYGLDIEVHCNLGDSLEPVKKTLLFRVARELLINVVKHARARSVEILLAENNGELQLTVADDGVGLTEAHNGSLDGFGLFSIGERMRNLGGHLDIDSPPGQGTRVSITLPVHEPR